MEVVGSGASVFKAGASVVEAGAAVFEAGASVVEAGASVFEAGATVVEAGAAVWAVLADTQLNQRISPFTQPSTTVSKT